MNPESNLLNGSAAQEAIRSINEKKELLQKAVALEVEQLNNTINSEFIKLGKEYYNNCVNFQSSDLTGIIEEINSLRQIIDEKNSKLAEITKRYDEELNILLATVKSQQELQAKQAGSSSACPKCSGTVSPGDVFCPYCGQKLAQPTAANTPGEACPNCKIPVNRAVDVFCHNCGTGLQSPGPALCLRCNAQVNPAIDAFCQNCGNPLK